MAKETGWPKSCGCDYSTAEDAAGGTWYVLERCRRHVVEAEHYYALEALDRIEWD